jgi:hypothetical protein
MRPVDAFELGHSRIELIVRGVGVAADAPD